MRVEAPGEAIRPSVPENQENVRSFQNSHLLVWPGLKLSIFKKI